MSNLLNGELPTAQMHVDEGHDVYCVVRFGLEVGLVSEALLASMQERWIARLIYPWAYNSYVSVWHPGHNKIILVNVATAQEKPWTRSMTDDAVILFNDEVEELDTAEMNVWRRMRELCWDR